MNPTNILRWDHVRMHSSLWVDNIFNKNEEQRIEHEKEKGKNPIIWTLNLL